MRFRSLAAAFVAVLIMQQMAAQSVELGANVKVKKKQKTKHPDSTACQALAAAAVACSALDVPFSVALFRVLPQLAHLAAEQD